MSRPLWIALAALVALAALLWLSRSRSDEVAPPPRPAEASRTRDAARYRALPRIEISAGALSRDEAAAAGVLAGTVRSSRSGAGIAGAQLHFAHGGRVTTASTGDDGRFAFRPAEAGTHDLLFVEADGHWPLSAGPTGRLARFAARPGERLDGAVIELDPIRPVTVTVVDPAGHAVDGARLRIDGEVAPDTPSSALTDAEGRTEISARRGAVVRASKAGIGVGRALVDEAAERNGALTVFLRDTAPGEEAGSIRGTVVGPDGGPLPFASVLARSQTSADWVAQATADERGRFRFSDLGAGAYDLVASLEGLAPGTAEDVWTGTQGVTLALAEGGAISGAVSAEDGAPVVSFTVVARAKRGALERGAAHTGSFFDAAGRYELRDLRPGVYALRVYAGGWAPSQERTVEIRPAPADAARADFVLSGGGRVFGRVVQADSGAPLAGATVSIESALGAVGASSRIFASATARADGSFELRGVPPGRQSLLAQAAGHDGRIVAGLEVGDDAPVGPITVTLRPTPEGRESTLQYTGIGAVLAAEGDALAIRDVIAGGGAEAAGLRAGDRIVTVGGQAVIELGFESAIHHIRGPVGSTVRLTLQRDGAAFEAEVERRAMD